MSTIRRFAFLFVVAGVVLTACGQPMASGTVIGARSVPTVQPSQGGPSNQVDWTAQELARQRQLAKEVAALLANPAPASGRLPLEATLTIKQIERLELLQVLGLVEVDSRLQAVAQLRAQVFSSRTMTSAQMGTAAAILDQAAAGLERVRARIENDRLVDQVRADLTTIGLFRVNGLLVPQIQLLVAAYEMHQLALSYLSQRAQLQQQINARQLANPNVGPAQTLANAMTAQISTMLSTSDRAAAILVPLRAADYPANQSALNSARQNLLAGQSAGGRAANDRKLALAQLGI